MKKAQLQSRGNHSYEYRPALKQIVLVSVWRSRASQHGDQKLTIFQHFPFLLRTSQYHQTMLVFRRTEEFNPESRQNHCVRCHLSSKNQFPLRFLTGGRRIRRLSESPGWRARENIFSLIAKTMKSEPLNYNKRSKYHRSNPRLTMLL